MPATHSLVWSHVAVWAVALLVALWAGWLDLRFRRIPNWLTVSGFVLGLGINAVLLGWTPEVDDCARSVPRTVEIPERAAGEHFYSWLYGSGGNCEETQGETNLWESGSAHSGIRDVWHRRPGIYRNSGRSRNAAPAVRRGNSFSDGCCCLCKLEFADLLKYRGRKHE